MHWPQSRRLALLLLCCVAGPSPAQIVGGRVIGDSSRMALPAVRVVLIVSETHRPVDSAVTDSTGTFYLNAPKPGTYFLRFDRLNTVSRISPMWTLAGDAFQQGEFVLDEGVERTAYMEADVDKPAGASPNNQPPRIPRSARDHGTPGHVLAQFIVDTTGHMLPESFRVLGATSPEFVDAAKSVIPDFKFFPAILGGKPVRQVVCMPFTWEPSGEAPREFYAEMATWQAERCFRASGSSKKP